MDTKVKELYTKDGKKLSELIQEWIDENHSFLYHKNCQKSYKDSKE